MSKKSSRNNRNLKTQQVSSVTSEITRIQQVSYQGPIPPPDVLEKFDKILPGAAERIINMAEKEQSHRHLVANLRNEQQNFINESAISFRKKGQLFGCLICVGSLMLSAYALHLGAYVAAASFGPGAIVALAFCFVYQTKHQE